MNRGALELELHLSAPAPDAALLAFRKQDQALGLTGMTGVVLDDTPTGLGRRKCAGIPWTCAPEPSTGDGHLGRVRSSGRTR